MQQTEKTTSEPRAAGAGTHILLLRLFACSDGNKVIYKAPNKLKSWIAMTKSL